MNFENLYQIVNVHPFFSIKIASKDRCQGFIHEKHTTHLQEILRHLFLLVNSQEDTKESETHSAACVWLSRPSLSSRLLTLCTH